MDGRVAGTGRRRGAGRSLQGGATIKDVALACGFSVATVSRTLQFPDRVQAATRAQVQAAINQLGYVPNVQARNLRTARSGLVIAMVPDITNPFFGGVIRGIEAVARAAGYSVLLGDTRGEVENERRFAAMVSGREADGMITLIPRMPRITHPAGHRPIVNICEIAPEGGVDTIRIDNVAASAGATRYLLGLGHRRLAHLGGPVDSPLGVARREGFAKAMRAAGLLPDPALMLAGAFGLEAGVSGVERVLAQAPDVTGFVCASDEIAIGALHGLRRRGIGVPAEVSLTGFDDVAISQYLHPPLSTVAQPCEALGGEAMRLLLARLRTPEAPTRHLVLETMLVHRHSTAPPPRGR